MRGLFVLTMLVGVSLGWFGARFTRSAHACACSEGIEVFELERVSVERLEGTRAPEIEESFWPLQPRLVAGKQDEDTSSLWAPPLEVVIGQPGSAP